MDIVSGLDIRVSQVPPKSDCDTRRFVLYGHVANWRFISVHLNRGFELFLQKSAKDVNYI